MKGYFMVQSIIEAVRNTAQEAPERYCIIDEKREYTYARMWQLILATADALRNMGIGRDSFVMAECSQDALFFGCNLACGLLGAVFVPLERKVAPQRALDIAGEVDASLMISVGDFDLPCRCITYDELLPAGREKEEISFDGFVMPKAEDLHEVMFTTGTTGKSKGVEITFANNVANAQNVSEGVCMQPGNLELVPVPVNHAHGLRTTYANLYIGGGVILVDGVMRVKAIFEKCKHYRATAIDLTPTAASVLLRLSKGRFTELAGQLSYVELGAAALTEQLKEDLRKTFPGVKLYNAYGSSESGRTCHLEFSGEERLENCIGRPTSNAHFIVTDDDRNPIESSAEHTGLLACKGPMNMRGYWKQPELTRETLSEDGYIFTNDEGYIDKDGLIYVFGRRGDVINYQGIKIAPDEIEEAALLYPAVQDCCCVPKADPIAGQIPKLFLVTEDPAGFDKKDFLAFLAKHVDNNKMPGELAFIDAVPRAYNGKLQRKKLLEK